MGSGDDTALPQLRRAPPVGWVYGTVRGSSGLIRPQCVAGGRHVRPLSGRSVLGQRQLARVLRRLPGHPRSGTPGGSGRGRRGRAPAPRRPPRRPRGSAGRPAGRQARARRRRSSSGGPPAASWPTWRPASGVPTATSVRTVPARLLEVNRQILNNQLARTTGAKVSFTHLIGYAIVRALTDVPALNAAFVDDANGTGQARRHPPQARRSRPGGRPAEERRFAHAARAVHPRRRHPRLPVLRPGLRGPHPQDPHREDLSGRLRRDHGVADQSGHPGHGAVGAAPHAGPGRHHRRRARSGTRPATRRPTRGSWPSSVWARWSR